MKFEAGGTVYEVDRVNTLTGGTQVAIIMPEYDPLEAAKTTERITQICKDYYLRNMTS